MVTLFLAASPTDPTTAIASTGVAGGCLLAFAGIVISGKMVSGKEYERVVEENRDLRQQIPNVVTALTLSTSALADSTTALRESAQVQRDTLVVLEVQRHRGSEGR